MESTSAQHKFDAPGSRAGVTVDLVTLLSQQEPAQRGEGMTTSEIAAALDCGQERVRRLIRQALAEKQCRVSRKTVTTIAGTQQRVVSYVLVQEAEQ